MKPNLSPEELLALSAYLDDALLGPERAALEQRLATDANLRRELESLRQTVALLQLLPVMKAPRDFTLDPAVYGNQAAPNVIRPALWQRIGLAVAALLMLVCGVGVGLQFFMFTGDDQDALSDVAANNTDTMFSLTSVAQDMPTETPMLVTAAALPADIIAKGTATASVEEQMGTGAVVENYAATPEITGFTAVFTETAPPTASLMPTLQATASLDTFDATQQDGATAGGSPQIETTSTPAPTQIVESAIAMPTSLPRTQDADVEEQGTSPVAPAMAETSPTLGIATGSSAAPAGDAETDRTAEDETFESDTADAAEPTTLDTAGEEAPSVNRNIPSPTFAIISRLVSALPAAIWQLLFNLIEALVGNVSH